MAFFETVWPAFEWIESVVLDRLADGEQVVRVLCRQSPPTQEWVECKAIIREILNEDTQHRHAQLMLEQSNADQQSLPPGATELISEAIFKAIAREMAPWRLDLGR